MKNPTANQMNRSELVTAASRYEMEIDMPNIDGIRVRSSKTGGYWKIVRTVEEINEIKKFIEENS